MQNPMTLFELNQLVKQTIDRNLAPAYWVVAEISDFKEGARGHAYLDLVEKTGNQVTAKMRANIWAFTYRGLAARFRDLTGQGLQNGMKVLAQVTVQFHELYGLSLNIRDIDPNFTIGERAKRKQEIIEKLAKSGLLDTNKQFPLPSVPQKVAIISSATAAGYGDFIQQVDNNRHGYKLHYKLFPATMQGHDAPDSIIAALQNIQEEQENQQFQLVILIRGGGAQIDMDCFDDYELAKAIAQMRIPVVTGIGHERDECIADLVAHTKVKTPTAVAEFILSGFQEFEETLNYNLKKIERAANFYLTKEQQTLRDREHILINLFKNKLQAANQYLDSAARHISTQCLGRVQYNNREIDNLSGRLQRQAKILLQQEGTKLEGLEKDLNRLDPVFFMKRGYTRTEKEGKSIEQSELQKGDQITTYTLTNKIESTITNIEEHGK
ncbi:exodeoxyribonuclease VII large subunit [Litoribacter populi]|uniref:exodeoxyribonuclease VII large subunit n=1 Tax=Litoribacter populi TaxID=2598460 RepID=UPI001180E158|nr:exodeoxyribonuclease VII large subunit [Litoribacter populi]